MFQEALQVKGDVILCYNRYNIVKIRGRVLPLLTWHISKIIVDFLFPIVTTCVLNQSSSHWLCFDALQSAITMCLKFMEKITNPFALVNSIDDDFGIAFDLFLFVSMFVCDVLDSFI
jgi:hypothetical protein